MSYNNEYYVMTPNFEMEEFKVIPTESTALRRFHYREQIYGQPALRFNSKGNKIIEKNNAYVVLHSKCHNIGIIKRNN
ncbi:hypothetical protein [Vibrio splendidus]|uniref:hypothetical protein n=1 Tax=Vibrio splendidus TaxID=29497 RepID=UPI0011B27F57|nr:hypothetical protein [Vibrio splendidus]